MMYMNSLKTRDKSDHHRKRRQKLILKEIVFLTFLPFLRPYCIIVPLQKVQRFIERLANLWFVC